MVYYIGTLPESEYLQHFGISGMKWGIRRYQNADGSLTEAGKARYYKQISKEANRDAKKYVNAKQYYGEGAGNRRKLLKGQLSEKMKNPDYKKAFDEAVGKQDLVAATKRARAERGARDTAKAIKRGAKVTAGLALTAVPLAIAVRNAVANQKMANDIFGDPGIMGYGIALLQNIANNFRGW